MINDTEHDEIDATLHVAPLSPPQWYAGIPSYATLQSEHFDFDRGIRYPALSYEQKKKTYLCGISFLLFQIQNDESLPKEIKDNAYYARIGASLLIHVKPRDFGLKNTIFLPASGSDGPGILIRLNSSIPYYYFSKWGDIVDDLKSDYKNNSRRRRFTAHFQMRRNLQERAGFENSKPMNIIRLSETLVSEIENDDKLKGLDTTNNMLISRAIAGAHIPDPGVIATAVKYQLELTFADLRFSEYLKSFSRPFSILSGEMQLISSSIKGETIQETDLHVHQAEYIGSWVDATVGLISSFTPAGWVFNTAGSVTSIAADLVNGHVPDSLAVAGLLLGCIPGGRIAAKVGKFTRIGGKAVKCGIMLGNKAVDLAIVGRSIKIAVDTGEPLAIYQALIASGMSVKNSYDMTRNMSLSLKLGEKIEESASLEDLKAIQNNDPEYDIPNLVERKFRIGSKEMLGRINNGEVEICNEHTQTWEMGSKLHLLAYRLQNASGGWNIPWLGNKIVIGEHTFKPVKYNQDKLNDMMRIAKTYTPTSNSTERIAKIQQAYRAGKEMSHEPQHDHYNSLSLDEKMDLFNKPDTDAITRGILAGKINESILNINLYKAAKAADDWRVSANKATDVVLVPQNIFLKGRAGVCLPASVLMGWALQSGQDAKLAKKLMSIYSSSNMADDPLYQSLVELHADGNASKFSGTAISDVKVSTLGDAELELFPTENSSVRVNIPEHTMLLSKVNQKGKLKYVFYDPNYGLSYFNKYEYMCDFFKKKIEKYDILEDSTTFYPLDYSRLQEVKIKGRNLDEILNGDMTGLYKQEGSTSLSISKIGKGASGNPLVTPRSGLLPASSPSIASIPAITHVTPELNPLRGYQDIKLGGKSEGIYPVLKRNGERLVTDQLPQLEVSYGPVDGQWDYLATTGNNVYRVSPDQDGRIVLRDSLLKKNNDGIIEFSSVFLPGGTPPKGIGSSKHTDPQASTSSASQSIQEPINVIDERISAHLSSDDESDFIWVTQVDITALTPVPEHYSPTEGSSILFVHSNGTELLLKKRPYPPQKVATQVKKLDGYNVREQEPLVLAACYAGAGGHRSIAQAFADTLQRPVVASSGTVHITTNDEKSTLMSAYSPLPFTTFHPIPTYQ
jgi:hypothetical protein